jgi:hypothetical protein
LTSARDNCGLAIDAQQMRETMNAVYQESEGDEMKRDANTVKHLNAWLDEQIHGDTRRELVREAMLALVDTDPEYCISLGWWHVYDRAKCDQIED